MRLVVISDTHNKHNQLVLPEGDILIHCGDATMSGRPSEVREFGRWFCSLPFKNKIFVAGNHDLDFERHPAEALVYLRPGLGYGTHYLQDNGVELHGLKFWGSPWSKEIGDWAFMRPQRDPKLDLIYAQIPDDCDVVITHGPPYGILDKVDKPHPGEDPHCGLPALWNHVRLRVRPKLHVFGHIHEGYGQEEHGGVKFGNASICDLYYRTDNKPLVYDL